MPDLQQSQRLIGVINTALVQIQKKLQAEQGQRKAGSIHLRVRDCGKKCRSCPHAEFVIWKEKIAKTGKTKGQSFLVMYPLKHPTRSSAAQKNSTVAAIVNTALELIELRARAVRAQLVFGNTLNEIERQLRKYG